MKVSELVARQGEAVLAQARFVEVPIRVVSINGDQFAVQEDGEDLGYVGPLNGGGWFALDGLGRPISTWTPHRSRREAVAAVLAYHAIADHKGGG